MFIESIASIFSNYPLGLVDECCDPTRGIARKVEFLSVKALIDWLDERLTFYRALERYVPPPVRPQLEAGPVTAEDCGNLMAKVAEELRASNKRSPLDEMHRQVADARRLRIEEVLRVSEAE